MYRILSAMIIIWSVAAGNARANGEHLQPEPSIYTGIWGFDYYTKVLGVLGELPLGETGVSPGGRIAVFVFPSFSPEYRVAVTFENGSYIVSYVRPKVHIGDFLQTRRQVANVKANPENPNPKTLSDEDWNSWKKWLAEEEAGLPDRLEDIELERCARKIDDTLAKKIFRIWEIMLMQTRYADDDAPRGTDGVTYHFTMHSMKHFWGMGGRVWSPGQDSNTGRLVVITRTMRRYCLEGKRGVVAQLTEQVKDLSGRLK